MIKDLLQVATIFLAIVERDGDTLGAKAARSTDSVQVVLSITSSWLSATALSRHIEVDHDLDLRDIDTARQQVCSDDDRYLTRAELGYHFVTLIRAHITKNDCGLEAFLTQHLVETIGVAPRIDENDCLRHLTDIEDALEEIWLLSLFASKLILRNVIKLKLLFAKVDLLGLSRELCDGSLDFVGIGGREEDVLDLLWQLRYEIGVDSFKLDEVALLTKEYIGLVNDEALQLRKIKLTLIASLLQVVVEFAESSDDDVMTLCLAGLRKVSYTDIRVLAQF